MLNARNTKVLIAIAALLAAIAAGLAYESRETHAAAVAAAAMEKREKDTEERNKQFWKEVDRKKKNSPGLTWKVPK
jgi:hypothetical protein